jgi:ribosome biogenesis GTPase
MTGRAGAPSAIIPQDAKGRVLGRIVAHHGKVIKIATQDGEVECKRPHREEWVVGDVVTFEKGRPRGILPRKNEFARKSPTGGHDALAANLDLLLVVTACGEMFKTALIDRFLVAAAHARITPIVALNKIDLPGAEEYIASMGEYSAMGYAVIPLSAATGAGFGALTAALGGGISAMVGQSGVGKTSILNRLTPGFVRATAALSDHSGKGKHTTSMAFMAPLPGGGAMIDSPGIRQFAPSGLEPEDLAQHFPGVAAGAGGCKFRDCLHESEPGCKVKLAVEEGRLTMERYESYLRILESIRDGREQDWWRRPEK